MKYKLNIFSKIRIALFLLIFISLLITQRWFMFILNIGNISLNYNVIILLLIFVFLIGLEYKKQYRNNLYHIIYCMICFLCFISINIISLKASLNIISLEDYLLGYNYFNINISYTFRFKLAFYDALVDYIIDTKIEPKYKTDILKMMNSRSNIQFLNIDKYSLDYIRLVISFQLDNLQVILNQYATIIDENLYDEYLYRQSLIFNIGLFIKNSFMIYILCQRILFVIPELLLLLPFMEQRALALIKDTLLSTIIDTTIIVTLKEARIFRLIRNMSNQELNDLCLLLLAHLKKHYTAIKILWEIFK